MDRITSHHIIHRGFWLEVTTHVVLVVGVRDDPGQVILTDRGGSLPGKNLSGFQERLLSMALYVLQHGSLLQGRAVA